MATNVTFDGNSLQSANVMVDTVDHLSMPTRDARIYALSHANMSVIPFDSFPSKTITVNGTVIDSTVPALDARLDTFKGWFSGKNKNLDIDYNGTTRRYTATANSISVTRPNNLTYATYSIEFICVNPFGQDISPTTAVTESGRTLAFYNDVHSFLGNAPTQFPVVTITYTGVTGGTGGSVNIGNASTGQTITVTRTWATGDVLSVDSSTSTVMVNGILADFTGAFPVFGPGSGTLTYTDNLTTRTFEINAIYYALWL